MIPTPPFVLGGTERGSGINREYALRDHPPRQLEGFEAARAYLDFAEEEGVSLRRNLVEILGAVAQQLEGGKSAMNLLGSLDEPKLRSSVKLFECVSRPSAEGGRADVEVNAVCKRILVLMKEPQLPSTAVTPKANAAGGFSLRDPEEEDRGGEDAQEHEEAEELGLEHDDEDATAGSTHVPAGAETTGKNSQTSAFLEKCYAA